MKSILIVFLFFPILASAKIYILPSGLHYEQPKKDFIEKIFILPSGLAYKEIIPIQNLKYLAQNLIPIAKDRKSVV